MTPPDLNTASLQALRRSLGALSIFLKAVMLMSSVLPDVPDWIWKPLAKLFPKIAALEDSLFNARAGGETMAALAKQRAEWDALMQEAQGSKKTEPQKNCGLQLIGATLPDFLEDHAIDFAMVETETREDTTQLSCHAPGSNSLPDHSGAPGLDAGRNRDLANSTGVCGSECGAATASDTCGSGSRLSAGSAKNEAPCHQTASIAEAPNDNLRPDHTGENRPPDSLLGTRLPNACAHATRKPTPRARPPPTDSHSKSSRPDWRKACPALRAGATRSARLATTHRPRHT